MASCVPVSGPYEITRTYHGLDATWMSEDVACRSPDVDEHIFHIDGTGKSNDEKLRVVEAKLICSTCPAIEPCREYGIEGKMYGIWGGTDEKERTLIRRSRARRRVAS